MARYEEEGEEKIGVCSQYLCHLVGENEPIVPIYLHKHRGFTLPENPEAPLIMIGPGTGIAPYLGFMQERIASGATGPHWLFFGERTRTGEYYYREYWEELVHQNRLKLDIAFSRDQKEKVYVQHRMLENGAELYCWIEKGAYLYVCGDAKRMAKDVEEALLTIFQSHGTMEREKALAFLSALRKEGRYLRDVY
jgi:sulfite reductase (NADPH) flavoprotein alpha-component